MGTITGGAGLVAGYVDALVATAGAGGLAGLRLVLDCANGSTSGMAAEVFRRAGADVELLHAEPDGLNINDGAGATNPAVLGAAVAAAGADAGLAFDGDGDRCIAVDATGAVVDGDRVIAICALDRQARGLLARDTVVVTVMTNLGFRLAMAERGISVVETAVGDRYVLGALAEGGFSLGGEQSGHVIFTELATTGDGMLTGLQLLGVVVRQGRPLATLAAEAMQPLPQVLQNLRLAAPAPDLLDAMGPDIAAATAELGATGRVLVRMSGTEPLLRVMVEAPTSAEADRHAARLVAAAARLAAVDAAERRAGRRRLSVAASRTFGSPDRQGGGASVARLAVRRPPTGRPAPPADRPSPWSGWPTRRWFAVLFAGRPSGRGTRPLPSRRMCGIVGVVSRPPRREPPTAAAVVAALDHALDHRGGHEGAAIDAAALDTLADRLRAVDAELGGAPGVIALVRQPELAPAVRQRLERVAAVVSAVDARLEATIDADAPAARELEALNAALVRVRDAAWAIGHDRLRTAAAVGELAGPGAGDAALAAFTAVQVALSALDRLEVRGRDSAGLHLLVRDHGLDLSDDARRDAIAARAADPLFASGAVRTPDGHLALDLQGGGRDRRARRQHQGAARRHRRRPPAARRPRRPRSAASPCSATPAGRASASSRRPTPIPSTPTSSR